MKWELPAEVAEYIALEEAEQQQAEPDINSSSASNTDSGWTAGDEAEFREMTGDDGGITHAKALDGEAVYRLIQEQWRRLDSSAELKWSPWRQTVSLAKGTETELQATIDKFEERNDGYEGEHVGMGSRYYGAVR